MHFFRQFFRGRRASFGRRRVTSGGPTRIPNFSAMASMTTRASVVGDFARYARAQASAATTDTAPPAEAVESEPEPDSSLSPEEQAERERKAEVRRQRKERRAARQRKHGRPR